MLVCFCDMHSSVHLELVYMPKSVKNVVFSFFPFSAHTQAYGTDKYSPIQMAVLFRQSKMSSVSKSLNGHGNIMKERTYFPYSALHRKYDCTNVTEV